MTTMTLSYGKPRVVTIEEVKELATRLTEQFMELGIEIPENTTYEVSSKMTRCGGVCQISYERNRYTRQPVEGSAVSVVRINQFLAHEDLLSILAHEMLHAAVPFEHHGYGWLRLVNKVNRAYPEYNITTKLPGPVYRRMKENTAAYKNPKSMVIGTGTITTWEFNEQLVGSSACKVK